MDGTQSGNVVLELYWQGYSKLYFGQGEGTPDELRPVDVWETTSVEVKVPGKSQETSAYVTSGVYPHAMRQLKFRQEVSCSAARTMTVAVRIAQAYQTPMQIIRPRDGAISRALNFIRSELPVSIDNPPVFEPGQTYQIRIISAGNALSATVARKADNESSLPL